MTTVIAVYNSDGCVGRCDARCHEADSDDCDCICGGVFHGVGKQRAEAGMQWLFENLADAVRPEYRDRIEAMQEALF